MNADLLRLAEKALRAAEAVLTAGVESNDVAVVTSGITQMTRALELVERLRPAAAEHPEDDFEAAVSDLLLQITQRASPACARCGSSCSECASEALPMGSVEDLYRAKASLARDRHPGGPESVVDDAVVVPDVPVLPGPVGRSVGLREPRALPRPGYDGPPGPVSIPRWGG